MFRPPLSTFHLICSMGRQISRMKTIVTGLVRHFIPIIARNSGNRIQLNRATGMAGGKYSEWIWTGPKVGQTTVFVIRASLSLDFSCNTSDVPQHWKTYGREGRFSSPGALTFTHSLIYATIPIHIQSRHFPVPKSWAHRSLAATAEFVLDFSESWGSKLRLEKNQYR